MGVHLKINSEKLAIFGTIWTPVKNFLTPPPPYRRQAFLKGGHAPINQSRGV